MPKLKPSAPEIAAAGWYVIVALSAIGGQGKTFFAELIALILQAAGYEVQVFSADVQRRLMAKLDAVVTLDTDLIDADDPLALLRAFSPFSQAVLGLHRAAVPSCWTPPLRLTSRQSRSCATCRLTRSWARAAGNCSSR